MFPVRRALISVSDKRGVAELASGLARLGVEILSTGGTERHLAESGVPVVPVSKATGSPEILGGRVKSLHPKIHGGILADRSRSEHLKELNDQGIVPIDLVVVNLYPFARTAARPGAGREAVVEMIDIGGPAMLRGAAKNHASVAAVVDPDDYPRVLESLEQNQGVVPEALRRELALKAFRHTQEYDSGIADWLEQALDAELEGGAPAAKPRRRRRELFPERLGLDLVRELVPRYGENPHQPAAVYRTAGGPGVLGGFVQHQGKELSYNNLLDADAARKIVWQLEEPAVVIVKHNNPCGAGVGGDLVQAYERALAGDPVSAFGSIVALNLPASEELAEAMAELFVEVVVAPGFADGARERFGSKANLRLLECPPYGVSPRSKAGIELRSVDGGFLGQAADSGPDEPARWVCRTKRQPIEEERRALELAWKVCRYTKSNAIVVANAVQTVGVGAGQMSRVDSCGIAIEKARQAGLELVGTAAASDAFFPFRDGVDLLAEAGVEAIVQPGGSKRDAEVVAAADEHGIAMVFTGVRHFRH
ncbi:MAG TPA: bifunctional phosphoribosylaminoimidazolecarboxamide formyltransferase/IMP cyclohydrolase [Thermoanaerobaculia bacterium]|nr:bifunctional phosphoribosylaminoimidazolecarboxamide formyltransferase/IMP cyclohydrolase [Thermoanaerobaculia bacterium]